MILRFHLTGSVVEFVNLVASHVVVAKLVLKHISASGCRFLPYWVTPDDLDLDTYAGVIRGHGNSSAGFKVFTSPFVFPVDEAPTQCRWSLWSFNATKNWRQSTIPLHWSSFVNSSSLLTNFQFILSMQNVLFPCLAALIVGNNFFKNEMYVQSFSFFYS